jgi:polygalacturonase
MSNEFNRRALLRYSALAGAGALTSPLWSGALPASAAGRSHRFNPADLAADRIVASVRRPRFPGRVFPVTGFGAAGDGTTDCTKAFAAAIAACHRAGGGHVIVPPGQFFTGAIHLLSNVDLRRHEAPGSANYTAAAYLGNWRPRPAGPGRPG